MGRIKREIDERTFQVILKDGKVVKKYISEPERKQRTLRLDGTEMSVEEDEYYKRELSKIKLLPVTSVSEERDEETEAIKRTAPRVDEWRRKSGETWPVLDHPEYFDKSSPMYDEYVKALTEMNVALEEFTRSLVEEEKETYRNQKADIKKKMEDKFRFRMLYPSTGKSKAQLENEKKLAEDRSWNERVAKANAEGRKIIRAKATNGFCIWKA